MNHYFEPPLTFHESTAAKIRKLVAEVERTRTEAQAARDAFNHELADKLFAEAAQGNSLIGMVVCDAMSDRKWADDLVASVEAAAG